jgi:hypothetical protein
VTWRSAIRAVTSGAGGGLLRVDYGKGEWRDVNIDHFTSGWNIEDISDFTKAGKYNIQTFDKISEKVGLISVLLE